MVALLVSVEIPFQMYAVSLAELKPYVFLQIESLQVLFQASSSIDSRDHSTDCLTQPAEP